MVAPPSRRTVLLGAGAVAVGGAAAVRALHEPDGAVVTGSFDSSAMRASTAWSVSYPPGSSPGDPLPLLLVLHGRGDGAADVLGGHRLGAAQASAVGEGTSPFAVVGVDGGAATYWHPRRSGLDPQAMLLDELLPMLAERGLRTSRIAVGGWSMGGYGALLLGQRLGSGAVACVAVDSPAVWTRPGDTAAGAFDDRADFLAHDVLAGAPRLAGVPVRVTCGLSDPFLPGVRALLAALPAAERDLAPGGHDLAWWRRVGAAQLAFVGRHLA